MCLNLNKTHKYLRKIIRHVQYQNVCFNLMIENIINIITECCTFLPYPKDQ